MKLASLFTAGAVLQREKLIPVWGWGTPDVLVTAELNGKKAYTKVAPSGKFMVRLPAMQAGGPYTLTVAAGEEKITVPDIMVGEVWVASGQSNMAYTLGSDWSPLTDAPEIRQNYLSRQQEREFFSLLKKNRFFRGFKVPMAASGFPLEDVVSSWEVIDENNADTYSAVAEWFAYYVQNELNVPVGIITSAWGGTFVEAWTSRNALLTNPDTADMVVLRDAADLDETIFTRMISLPSDQVFSEITKPDPGNTGVELGYAKLELNDSDWKDMFIPGNWILQKIAGHGAVWFRKRIRIPASWEGQELELHLGGIDKHDITYFNGVEIGRTGKEFETKFWNVRRRYKISPDLVKNGESVIAVRAFSFIYDGGFGGTPSLYYIKNPATGELIELAGKWKAFAEVDFGQIFADSMPQASVSYGAGNQHTPGILFDSMIRPLIPYGIRGVIWYQGENNTGNIADAMSYRRKITTMVDDWRREWGQGCFPFLQVQLANFTMAKEFDPFATWALLRESQAKACSDIPELYFASAIDVGDGSDIHPFDKKSVGYRLSRIAISEVYHREGIVPNGPVYNGYCCEGSAIRVFFRHGEGLHFRGGTPKHFYVMGRQNTFFPADQVIIDGKTILVSSKEVPAPLAVRYSWANNPNGNLYNGAELPAGPFRTDYCDNVRGW